MKEVARRLLFTDTATTDSASHVQQALSVIENLRVSLVRFAGADSFTVLMRRALVLAQVEVPELRKIKVVKDGQLEGLEQLAEEPKQLTQDSSTTTVVHEAPIAVLAQLLGLLVRSPTELHV